MTKKDWHRFWLHLPVGIVAAIVTFINPCLGIPFTFIFISYEFINDWRKHDHSYKDVFGFAFGYGIMAALLCLPFF